MKQLTILSLPSLNMCATAAVLQLLAGIGEEKPLLWRASIAIICILFVILAEYLDQRDREAWLHESPAGRCGSIFFSAWFALWTQFVSYWHGFEWWFRIFALAFPLGMNAYVHIRARRKKAVEIAADPENEKQTQAEL